MTRFVYSPEFPKDADSMKDTWRRNTYSTCVQAPLGESVDNGETIYQWTGSDTTTGGTFIYGQTGSGKTMLLNSIATSHIAQYSPRQVSLVTVDASGHLAELFGDAPHTMGSFTIRSTQDVYEVCDLVENVIRSRRDLIGFAHNHTPSDIMVRSFDGYNFMVDSGKVEGFAPLPRIVILVDQLSLINDYSSDIWGTISQVCSRGAQYGVHVVAAAQPVSHTVYCGLRIGKKQEQVCLAMPPEAAEKLGVARFVDTFTVPGEAVCGMAGENGKLGDGEHCVTFYVERGQVRNVVKWAQDVADGDRAVSLHSFR